MTKIFIDGSVGTTGLRIVQRLSERRDISLITVDESRRRDADYRRECIAESDITFLCLPDDASRESVALAEGTDTKIIDASTAHRTNPAWCYGFPELSKAHREALKTSSRTAVPGCHASGVIALLYPLISSGIMPKDYPVAIHSLTGYSGGGKSMIAEYQEDSRAPELSSPREYGLSQTHKHLPEISTVCGLSRVPLFSPIVADYYSGMRVTIPLFTDMLAPGTTQKSIRELFCEHYNGQALVKVAEAHDEKFLASNLMSGLDSMTISIYGNDERILLSSCFDNLGKGASGAAIQCMNIMLGLSETTGLSC